MCLPISLPLAIQLARLASIPRACGGRDFSEQSIRLLSAAYKLVYRKGLDLQTALGELDKLNGDNDNDNVSSFADFLRKSQRGIIR